MNVIESDLLYTARSTPGSGSEFTDPGPGSGLVWPGQAAPAPRERRDQSVAGEMIIIITILVTTTTCEIRIYSTFHSTNYHSYFAQICTQDNNYTSLGIRCQLK